VLVRLRPLLVGLALLAGACAGRDDIHRQRVGVLADTCVSIIERRVGDDFDREALESRAGAAAMTEIYERFDGRRPAGVSILRRQCRIRP